MEEKYYLIELLTAAQHMAKKNGDIVLSYLINMALLHAQQTETETAQDAA